MGDKEPVSPSRNDEVLNILVRNFLLCVKEGAWLVPEVFIFLQLMPLY